MPAGIQKNVRLSEREAELLRALKYDLDASDGEVIASALEQQALTRLKYHVAMLKRGRLGLIDDTEAAASRAPIEPLLTALNCGKERVSVQDGILHVRGDDADWARGGFSSTANATVMTRAFELVKEMALPHVTVSVILLACCETPEGKRCGGLGIPIEALTSRLRETLVAQRADRDQPSTTLTWAAKSVFVEGCKGIKALDGVPRVGVEHILVAALQSEDQEVVQIRRELDINADRVRALLWAGTVD